MGAEITPLPCFVTLHSDPNKSSSFEGDPLEALYRLEDPPYILENETCDIKCLASGTKCDEFL